MSDNNSLPITRSRRPKRLPTKTNDDNVLGISWKEERELRKAMYVSLRQQHQPSTGPRLRSRGSPLHPNLQKRPSATKNGFKVNAIRRDSGSKMGSAHVNRTAQAKLRTAKLRATSRLRSDAVCTDPKAKRGSWAQRKDKENKIEKEKNSVKKKINNKEAGSSKTPHLPPSNSPNKTLGVLNVARSIVRARLNGHFSKVLRRHAPNHRQPIAAQTSRRPTLMSASNDSKVTSHYKRPLSPKRSRLRSPVKFTPLTPSCGRTNGRSFKSNLTPSDHHSVSNPAVIAKSPLKKDTVSPGTATLRPERRLFCSTETPSAVPAKRTPDVIPRALCQDPDGRPVSVHDFVEFICYSGTPCLNPKLKWLNHTRTHYNVPVSSNSSQPTVPSCRPGNNLCPAIDSKATKGSCPVSPVCSPVKACPSGSAKPEDRLGLTSEPQPFSRSPKIHVAKKLASAHPHDGRTPILPSPSELAFVSPRSQKSDSMSTQSPVSLSHKRCRSTRGFPSFQTNDETMYSNSHSAPLSKQSVNLACSHLI